MQIFYFKLFAITAAIAIAVTVTFKFDVEFFAAFGACNGIVGVEKVFIKTHICSAFGAIDFVIFKIIVIIEIVFVRKFFFDNREVFVDEVYLVGKLVVIFHYIIDGIVDFIKNI